MQIPGTCPQRYCFSRVGVGAGNLLKYVRRVIQIQGGFRTTLWERWTRTSHMRKFTKGFYFPQTREQQTPPQRLPLLPVVGQQAFLFPALCSQEPLGWENCLREGLETRSRMLSSERLWGGMGDKAGNEAERVLKMSEGPPMCAGGSLQCVWGGGSGQLVLKRLETHGHTLCTQPPSDGAVMGAADESGVPAKRPLSLLWPFLYLGALCPFWIASMCRWN